MILSPLDMHTLIDQEIQSMGLFTYQGLKHEEIDLQINAQIDLFVEAVIDKHKRKVPRIGVKEGFQVNQARLDDLRTIHVKDATLSLSSYRTNNYQFSLPSDYSHHIKTIVNWSINCSDKNNKATALTGDSSIRVVNTEDVEIMRDDPFYSTTKESPLAEIVNNTGYIYTEGLFTLTSAFMDYIKKPAVVLYAVDGSGNYDPNNSVTCDLPHTVHRIIVRMTAIHIATIIGKDEQTVQNLQEETNN